MIMGLATIIALIITGAGICMSFTSIVLSILSNYIFDKSFDNQRLRKIVRKLDSASTILLLIGAPLSLASYIALLILAR